jgi:hypothetical protein
MNMGAGIARHQFRDAGRQKIVQHAAERSSAKLACCRRSGKKRMGE